MKQAKGVNDEIKLKQLKNLVKTKKNIYVELDSVVDTRLSTLYFLSPTIGEQEVQSGRYRRRIRDNFGPISYDIFRRYYNSRSKAVLEYGLPTYVVDLVKTHYGDLITDITQIELEEDVKIFINIFPYDLLEEEQEVIIKMFKEYIDDCEIEIIYKSPKDLTPKWVLDNVGCMFMYDALPWLEYHSSTGEIYNHPILNVMLFTPALVTGDGSNLKIDKEYFESLQKALEFTIDINLIDAYAFSAMDYESTYIPTDEEIEEELKKQKEQQEEQAEDK